MSNIDQDNTEATVSKEAKHEYKPGNRGEIGQPTAALTLKQRYHQAHFDRVDAEDKKNPSKKMWVKHPGAPSLKQFARGLVSKGDPNAKDWLDHKSGSLNQKRSDANIVIAHAAFAATKLERRKKKGTNG